MNTYNLVHAILESNLNPLQRVQRSAEVGTKYFIDRSPKMARDTFIPGLRKNSHTLKRLAKFDDLTQKQHGHLYADKPISSMKAIIKGSKQGFEKSKAHPVKKEIVRQGHKIIRKTLKNPIVSRFI